MTRERVPNFVAGETVFIVSGFGPDPTLTRATVEKVGKLHLTLIGGRGVKYAIDTGMLARGDAWNRQYIAKSTPVLEATYRRHRLLGIVESAKWEKMDDGPLEAVARIVVEARKKAAEGVVEEGEP